MIVKIRNYTLGVVMVGLCLMGLIGPLLYPELMVQTQMEAGMVLIPQGL